MHANVLQMNEFLGPQGKKNNLGLEWAAHQKKLFWSQVGRPPKKFFTRVDRFESLAKKKMQ